MSDVSGWQHDGAVKHLRERALRAEKALVLIRANCVALANDDDPDVEAASRLAYKLRRQHPTWKAWF